MIAFGWRRVTVRAALARVCALSGHRRRGLGGIKAKEMDQARGGTVGPVAAEGQVALQGGG